jgi:hypothetical protein
MSNNTTDPNHGPGGDDPLQGGTQHMGAAGNLANVGGQPGGTNALTPAGGSHPEDGHPGPRSGGTRTESQNEPEELFEGSRKPSHAVAKQKARDDADVDTTGGLPPAPGNPRQQDETDPTGQTHSTHAVVPPLSTKEGENAGRS